MAAGWNPHASSGRRSLPSPWRALDGKVVMVTGASSGIGRELCLDLAKAGCRIVAAARRVDRLRSLCEEIGGMAPPFDAGASSGCAPPRAAAVALDVTADGSAIEASVRRAWDAFGRIDALVNNAGVRGGVHSALEVPKEEWDDVLTTNLTGSWLVSKYVCEQMQAAKQGGSVINVASIAGLTRGQLPGGVHYSASKAGVNCMTRVMALELGPYNIRVNSISPGVFKSEITESLMKKEWLNKVTERTVPLKTLGTTNPAVTSVVRYLIHDASEYVTGNVFVVDAGATLLGVPLFSSL